MVTEDLLVPIKNAKLMAYSHNANILISVLYAIMLPNFSNGELGDALNSLSFELALEWILA